MWLISDRHAREMRARIAAGFAVDAGVQSEFAASALGAVASDRPRNLKVVDGVAEIAVEGLLTERPDFFAWFFGYGNTTYRDIQQALALAASDPAIKRVVLNVNSPGGQIDGLFDTLAALDAFGKPKKVVTSLAASAAYAIASLGGKIEATNAAVEVGSIGILQEFWVYEDLVQVTSSEAPNKRPDVKTEEGQAVVRAELDELHAVFVEAIAKGRGTTVKNVNESFGRGGLVIAGKARQRGMIDRIQKAQLKAVTAPPGAPEQPALSLRDEDPSNSALVIGAGPEPDADASAADDVAGETPPAMVAPVQSTPSAAAETQVAKPKGKTMDPNTLKSEHSDCYAAILKTGREAGEAAGVKQERDRVTAHLIRGKANDAMDLAIESVENGAEMTETLKAKYDTAGKNKADAEAREQELAEANAAADGAAAAPETQSFADRVVARLQERKGQTAA